MGRIRITQLVRELDILVTSCVLTEGWAVSMTEPSAAHARNLLPLFHNSYKIMKEKWGISEATWAVNAWCRYMHRALDTLRLCRGDIRFSVSCLIMPHESCETSYSVLSQLKNACLRPIGRYLRSVPDSIPDSPMYRGRLKRIVWNWLSTRRSPLKELYCNTLLQLKRVTPCVPDSFISLLAEKHRSLVSIPESRQSREFIEAVVSTSKEFLKTKRVNLSGQREDFAWEYAACDGPRDFSMRSCVERSIGDGGVYGFWMDPKENNAPLTTQISGSSVAGSAVTSRATTYRWVTNRRLENIAREKLSTKTGARAVVVGIPEPLKVRWISKNAAWCSPFWADFQKTLFAQVSRRKEIYTGKVLTSDHFTPFFSFIKDKPDWVIVSDDASNATGSISPDFTWAISKDCIPPAIWDIYYDSLRSTMEYPGDLTAYEKSLYRQDFVRWVKFKVRKERRKRGEDDKSPDFEFKSDDLYSEALFLGAEPYPDPVESLYEQFKTECEEACQDGTFDHLTKQVNGQMMGDRRSFPLLCLIHLSVKKYFLNEFLPEFSNVEPWKVPIAINGDDGLFCIPKALVPIYFQFIDELWSLNPLKSYVHRDYLSFNSKLWKRKGGKAVALPLIRWNLIENIDKSGAAGKDPRVWNEVVASLGQKAELSGYLFTQFENRWNKILKQLCKGGNNYFLPCMAGGLGLVLPCGRDLKTTPKQRGNVVRLTESIAEGLRPSMATRIKVHTLPSLRKSHDVRGFVRRVWRKDVEGFAFKGPMQLKEVTSTTQMIPGRLCKRYTGNRSLKPSLKHLDSWKYVYADSRIEVPPEGFCDVEDLGPSYRDFKRLWGNLFS